MIEYGQYNTLKVSRRSENGFYLIPFNSAKGDKAKVSGDEPSEEVLLPRKYITPEMKEGSDVKVFVYKDSEDRPVATTQTPLATVGEAAYLLVKEITNIGAFLDWGLDKDLFLPFREQAERVEAGRHYLVYLYLDFASKRIAATTNLNKFIKNREVNLQPNEEVDLLITYENEVGIRVIINNKHWGILFKNEIFQKIEKGQHVHGFIKKIREDGKIDVALQKQGIAAAQDVRDVLLNKLKEHKGFLQLSDISPPEEIHAILGISKKNFKKAVGMLYKEGKIELKEGLIRLKLK
jgi:predicted RNA-binding protein (virulence factor B family)